MSASAPAVNTRTVPLLDLRAQFETMRGEIMPRLEAVAESQAFILGEEVKQLEAEIAAYSQAQFGIGCASGSDALMLALMAYGIGAGDEVVTAPYTFFATGGAIHRLGATPVYIDVDADTFNMNVAQLEAVLEKRPNVKAIVPIHLFGACADMDPICQLAGQRGIPVIEDAAQAIGAEYKGRRAGSIGDIGCFSFFPSKNLGCFGDGGMCTAQDAAVADRLRVLRVHGSKKKYYHEVVGVNSRLDALQAAILRVKLRHLDEWTAGRQRNADLYREMIAALNVPVTVPRPAEYQTRHIYNQFVIRCERRDELQAFLKENGVGTEVYYPLPLHLQPCFAGLGYKPGDLPVSERLSRESLALPVYPELQADDIEYVVTLLRSFYA
jgi:dTDP-4-amino-4,6-dideoxygalactose transaminase